MKQNKPIFNFCHVCIPCYLPDYLDCNGVRIFLLQKETCPWWLCLCTWNWSPWLSSDLRLMRMVSSFLLTLSIRSVSSLELIISTFASYKLSHNPHLFPSSYSYPTPPVFYHELGAFCVNNYLQIHQLSHSLFSLSVLRRWHSG